MTHDPQEEPFQEAHLNSPEYRDRLMRKLNCLIAVLEVATAKVRKSLNGPTADAERLGRIRSNLQSTLDVCLRARAALERREPLPSDLPENLTQVIQDAQQSGAPRRAPSPGRLPLPRGARVEMRSNVEAHKFERMGRIEPRELGDLDLDDLARRLQS